MSQSSATFISWVLTATAVVLWIAVPLFMYQIWSEQNSISEAAKSEETQSMKGATALRTHALLESTTQERSTLDATANVDVISIVDMIEASGKAAGVPAQVSGAITEAGAKNDPIASLSFSIQAEGSFDALMRLSSLLERLPLVTSLEELKIEKNPEGDQWKLSARLRVRTTASLLS